MYSMNFEISNRGSIMGGQANTVFLVEVPGSPCPMCVVDAGGLPTDDDGQVRELERVRAQLVARGHADVLKFALIYPRDPWADLYYKFVQCIPGEPDRFDLNGSCGHGIIGSIMAARCLRWLPRLAPGTMVRVNIINNGESVTAEVKETTWPNAGFTVHFRPPADARLGKALPTGQSTTEMAFENRRLPMSFVTVSNPYVFVDAQALGLHSQNEMFSDDPELFARLVDLRKAATTHLGLPIGGAFPKLAMIGQFEPGRLVARALSVPSWHPTLALTGTVCLAAATAIEDSIPFELARRAGLTPGSVTIQTPGNVTGAIAQVTGTSPEDRLLWTSVSGKRAHFVKRLILDGEPGQRDLCPTAVMASRRQPSRTRRSRSAARTPSRPSAVRV